MVFTLPTAEPAAAAAPVSAASASAKKSSAVTVDLFPPADRGVTDRKPARRSERDERDNGDERDRDDRRRKSRARRSGSPWPWILGIGAAVLAVVLLCGGTITVLVIVAMRNANPAVRPVIAVNEPPPNVPNIPPGGKGGGAVQPRQGPATRVQLVNGGATVNSQLTFQDPADPKDNQFRCKIFQVELQAGRTYTVDMTSPNQLALDPYLRIEDVNGRVLAEDDDSGGGLNARIHFRPAQTGPYVLIATCYNANQTGPFTLSIREMGK
jgi:hypothetical protein